MSGVRLVEAFFAMLLLVAPVIGLWRVKAWARPATYLVCWIFLMVTVADFYVISLPGLIERRFLPDATGLTVETLVRVTGMIVLFGLPIVLVRRAGNTGAFGDRRKV